MSKKLAKNARDLPPSVKKGNVIYRRVKPDTVVNKADCIIHMGALYTRSEI